MTNVSPPRSGARRLLILVTEDWAFCSHRIGVARAARDAGWDVHVACRVRNHGDQIRAEGLTLHPIGINRSSLNPLREFATIRELRRLYRRVRPDVLHHAALKPVLYGTLAARLAGVNKIVNAMIGMGSVFSSSKLAMRLARPGVVSAFRMLLNAPGSMLVVQNQDDADLFLSRGLVAPERLRLIPGSGVDTEAFSVCPEPSRDGPIVATVVARMLWDKGIGEMVEAARLLRARNVPVKVCLVGDRDGDNPNAIPMTTLQQWRAEGIVDWQGRRDDIATVWAESHIAVLPSYREGMPRSLLEAAACGRPLVTTDVPGCRALVDDGINGIKVAPRDPEALADAVARLAADPTLRHNLGARARRSVETTFGDHAVLGAFLSLYDEVMNWPSTTALTNAVGEPSEDRGAARHGL
ncbi:glycosyltransferase family 4 protein [Caenispirillum salinarum]|uniref:glycosyltransferase family 4 protein n=1 Tax=Caenispirillum salinarum TaxID=859058 RepID=UPI00384D3C4C